MNDMGRPYSQGVALGWIRATPLGLPPLQWCDCSVARDFSSVFEASELEAAWTPRSVRI